MINLITKKGLLYTRQDVWFYDGEDINFLSNNLFYQAKKVPNLPIVDLNDFWTSYIDLTKEEDTIYQAINSNFRNEIRRAEKEGISSESIEQQSKKDLEIYLSSYGDFCKLKNLQPPDKDRTQALFSSTNFLLTNAKYQNINIVTHAYIYDKARIRLLNSYHNLAFSNPKLQGFANKYLHWKDITLFKAMGWNIYDFGGIDKEKTSGITKFKIGFGGIPEQSFNFTVRQGIYKKIKKII